MERNPKTNNFFVSKQLITDSSIKSEYVGGELRMRYMSVKKKKKRKILILLITTATNIKNKVSIFNFC